MYYTSIVFRIPYFLRRSYHLIKMIQEWKQVSKFSTMNAIQSNQLSLNEPHYKTWLEKLWLQQDFIKRKRDLKCIRSSRTVSTHVPRETSRREGTFDFPIENASSVPVCSIIAMESKATSLSSRLPKSPNHNFCISRSPRGKAGKWAGGVWRTVSFEIENTKLARVSLCMSILYVSKAWVAPTAPHAKLQLPHTQKAPPTNTWAGRFPPCGRPLQNP